MSEWQLIETAPDSTDEVLLWGNDYIKVVVGRRYNGVWHHTDHDWLDTRMVPPPTHWRPFPQPPMA